MKKHYLIIAAMLGMAMTASAAADERTATFDDNPLEAEGFWRGDTQDEDYMQGTFTSGAWEFNNSYIADWDFWDGFAYSARTSNTFAALTDQFNSAAGPAYSGSNFGVVYVSGMMGKVTLAPADGKPAAIRGMWITNSAWAYDYVKNGDYSVAPFGEGDYFILTLTGTTADNVTVTMDIPLADYRAEKAADRWALTTWEWIDLSELGPITMLEWTMTSTQLNDWGVATPTYVCIDDFDSPCPAERAEAVELTEDNLTFDVAPLFSFDPEAATVTYSLKGDEATLEGSTLNVDLRADESAEILLHATQCGRHEYVILPVSVKKEDGLNTVGVDATAPAEYFDLQGRRILNPAPGTICIMRRGTAVSKIIF